MTQPARSRAPLHWLSALRRYFTVILLGNLVWEFAHFPLYTLWTTGTLSEKVFAIAHCTMGDLLIAAASLLAALVVAGDARWPLEGFARVTILAVAAGLGYTAFSEWLNTTVRGSWAYTDAMPLLPVLGIGLTPLLQWIVVPVLAFGFAGRHSNNW